MSNLQSVSRCYSATVIQVTYENLVEWIFVISFFKPNCCNKLKRWSCQIPRKQFSTIDRINYNRGGGLARSINNVRTLTNVVLFIYWNVTTDC